MYEIGASWPGLHKNRVIPPNSIMVLARAGRLDRGHGPCYRGSSSVTSAVAVEFVQQFAYLALRFQPAEEPHRGRQERVHSRALPSHGGPPLGGALQLSYPAEVQVPQVVHPQAVPHEHQRLLHPQPLLAQHYVAFH